jgi:hypothetical protein
MGTAPLVVHLVADGVAVVVVVAGEVDEAAHGLWRGLGAPVAAAALVEVDDRPDPGHGLGQGAGRLAVPGRLAARVGRVLDGAGLGHHQRLARGRPPGVEGLEDLAEAAPCGAAGAAAGVEAVGRDPVHVPVAGPVAVDAAPCPGEGVGTRRPHPGAGDPLGGEQVVDVPPGGHERRPVAARPPAAGAVHVAGVAEQHRPAEGTNLAGQRAEVLVVEAGGHLAGPGPAEGDQRGPALGQVPGGQAAEAVAPGHEAVADGQLAPERRLELDGGGLLGGGLPGVALDPGAQQGRGRRRVGGRRGEGPGRQGQDAEGGHQQGGDEDPATPADAGRAAGRA